VGMVDKGRAEAALSEPACRLRCASAGA
jgi:hypothetical protein